LGACQPFFTFTCLIFSEIFTNTKTQDMKKAILFICGITLAFFIGISFFGKGRKASTPESVNPEFKEWIAAYTSGYVTVKSNIRVVLQARNEKAPELNKELENNLFKVSPSVNGKIVWLDESTVEFHPSEKLKHDQEYDIKFKLGEIAEVKRELREFEFNIQTIPQAIDIEITDYATVDKGSRWYQVSGVISTSDECEAAQLEKTLTAAHEGANKKVSWTHENLTTHRFTIERVQRNEQKNTSLVLEYNGEAVEARQSGKEIIEIPAASNFNVMKVKVTNNPDQQAVVFFSDNLQQPANMNGLFTLGGKSDINYSIERNKLTIFPENRLSGTKDLTLSGEIKSEQGKNLKGELSFNLAFEEMKPEIRFTGKGNIIPGEGKLLLPFEAVNLSAVDVKIKKIYEKNILQFLQVNSLEGTSELYRVGKTVFKKRIELSSLGALPQNKWQNYALDLSKLIKTEPGAIYNVTLNFKKAYSIYNCSGDTSAVDSEYSYDNTTEPSASETEDDEENDNYYDYDYGYSYYEDYDYRQRENPCHPSYYAYGKSISRNILSSNVALMAKRGNDGSITVLAADILTAHPLANIELEAYDYQQVLIGNAKTNSGGIAEFKLKKKPFAIVGKSSTQKSYLKLDDGTSLSMSMFDVEGEEIKKGMKGFLYGERGIWRPGDSLFLTFIIENKENKIPANFPVSMEILNPQGQVVQKITRTKNLDGFYNFSTATEPYAPTGNYTAKVKAGGATFTKNLRIETVMPNRLKLNLDFKTALLHGYEPLSGDLQVNWLHGAPGRNLETKVDLALSPGKTEFPKFKDYVFQNPASSFNSEAQTIFTGKTNEEGFVKVNADLSAVEEAPGFLNANFTVRGFEEGGAFSTDRFTIPLSPYKEYVGLKLPKAEGGQSYLYTGKDHEFELVNVDESGKLLPATVEVKIYKVSWRWWWDDYSDDFSSYMSSEYNTPLETKAVNLPNGKGNFSFRIDQPEWGRYLVLARNNATGHTTGSIVFIDWPAWEGKSPKGNEGANFLSVTTEKKEYNLKEMVKIHFPSSEGSTALITVENGSKVIKSFWAATTKDSTDAWLEISEEMTPNVYIYVTLIQPHANSKNDLPIRLYGVAPIKVNDPTKILKPIISSLDTWKPETEGTVRISEADGREMTYTLAVVDEGLLDLTRFKTPDPYKSFYSKEALGVKTWDVYDEVMGATAGGIQRILSIGGDEGLENKPDPNAQRFKPMVRFIGPFHLDKGKTNTHKIDIPQYVGSVKIMCVAGMDYSYGNAEKIIPVRKPLMILSTLPRVLGPGEEVDLPVTVFAMESKVKNAKITVLPDKNFSLPEENMKSIGFSRIGDQVVNFRLKVKETTGWAKVKIIAEGAGEKSVEEINIEIRSPNPKMTDVKEGTIEAGKSFVTDYVPFGMSGTNDASVEVSSIPALNLEQRLNYLLEYPHGCIEQTTSAVFAQLYLGDLTELNANQKAMAEKNIKAAIARIKTFQTGSGGFSYWPGSNTADEWGTAYAGHFLIEAQKKGYSIPYGLLDGWKKFQREKAQQWQASKNAMLYREDLTQTYRLYTLALSGSAELGAMNRLKENKNLSLAAKWRLAAAYVHAGQKETARKIIANASTKIEKYNQLSYTYGSTERDEAMILETLSLLKEKNKGFEMLKRVAGYLSDESWMSTQSTAYCLISISAFVKDNDPGAGINAVAKIGKTSSTINSKQSFRSIKIENAERVAGISIKNTGNGILFVRVTRKGVPAAGNEKEGSNNLSLKITYKTMTGEDLDVSKLAQGTDFVAEVTVVNSGYRGYLENLALTQIFPSGWEIHNSRLNENSDAFAKTSVPNYQDIRDDRIYTYYELGNGGKKTFRVILNASYTGKFYLPGVKTEAMYDASIFANKAGYWVEVVKGGTSS
jgi:alpha-2-macroglobulin